MRHILIAILTLFLFSSCKTHNLYTNRREVNKSFNYDPNYQYRIRVDDKISMSVWGEDNLSVGTIYGVYNSSEVTGKWMMVDHNGNIELPQLGTLYVLGKTVPELKEELKQKFKKWLVEPIVDAKVINKQIAIVGEVIHPDVMIVDKDHYNILEIVSKAGGFDFYANLKKIKILRQEGDNYVVTNIDMTKSNDIINNNIFLHPSDIVIVPSRKSKNFDKRIAALIPVTSTVGAAAILMNLIQ